MLYDLKCPAFGKKRERQTDTHKRQIYPIQAFNKNGPQGDQKLDQIKYLNSDSAHIFKELKETHLKTKSKKSKRMIVSPNKELSITGRKDMNKTQAEIPELKSVRTSQSHWC